MTNREAGTIIVRAERVQKRPTFLWQGILILLPLALLLGFGIYSLQQDKKLAEAEAKDRAQRYADELERKISGALAALAPGALHFNSANADVPAFIVSQSGELISPPAVTPLTPTPLPVSFLNDEQTRLWNKATLSEFTTNRATAIKAYRDFLNSSPPQEFRVRASYSLALLLDHSPEARSILSGISSFTNGVSDAGLPLPLLAKIQLVQMAFNSTNARTAADFEILKALCDEAVQHPTALTPSVLDLNDRIMAAQSRIPMLADGDAPAALRNAQRQWANDEASRAIYAEMKKRRLTPPPHLLWIDAGEPFLAISQSQFSHIRVVCYPEAHVQKIVDEILNSATYIPDYFGITVEIAGRELGRHNTQPWHEISYFSPRSPGEVIKIQIDYSTIAPTAVPIMATADGSGDNSHFVTVNILLTSKAALFARQRTRTQWFICLIVASGLVGVSGLWRSWRIFVRQQKLNEMKSNFVSSVSHELRAPIASVRLLAEALDRGAVADEPKRKEYFRFIVQECHRLTGLIENVLDFSRIEQGRKKHQVEETDLKALVEQTAKLMRPAAEERGVKLDVSIPNDQCSMTNVQCDGLALQQALVNLIDNAIKHSANGQNVTVSLSSFSNRISISVADHGPGIPAAEHEKIFERFYRRGSELRRETQGIGIGLTIVKHVAEAHGGRVLVQSVVGQGSTFTIELPHRSADSHVRAFENAPETRGYSRPRSN